MKNKTAIIVVLVAGVLVVAGALAAWMKLSGGEKGPTGDIVRLAKPEQGELVEFVNAPGEVEPLAKVAISARVMARIIELPYEEGDHVTKGDPDASPAVPSSVLVKLDATDLQAALESAEARRAAQQAQVEVEKARLAGQEAQLAGTKITLVKAELDYRRTEELCKSKDTSQSDLDTAKSRYEELAAQYEAAKYSLEASKMNLEVLKYNLAAADAEITRARDAVSYTTITSPIDGVVTRVNAKEGELAVTGTMNNPGTVILEVADLSQMRLVVQVDEADVGNVRAGQKASVRIHTYPDEKFTGTVESIALTQDYGSGGAKYYKTKILLDPSEKNVYSGLTADVDIETVRHEGILKVPSQAVLGRKVDDLPLEMRDNNANVDTNKTYATVVYRFKDGKAAVTPVTTGANDATHTIITSGLAAEDQVVIGPYKALEGLSNDQKVQDEREVEKAKKEKEAEAAKKDAAAKGDGKAKATGSTDSSVTTAKGDRAAVESTDSSVGTAK